MKNSLYVFLISCIISCDINDTNNYIIKNDIYSEKAKLAFEYIVSNEKNVSVKYLSDSLIMNLNIFSIKGLYEMNVFKDEYSVVLDRLRFDHKTIETLHLDSIKTTKHEFTFILDNLIHGGVYSIDSIFLYEWKENEIIKIDGFFDASHFSNELIFSNR